MFDRCHALWCALLTVIAASTAPGLVGCGTEPARESSCGGSAGVTAGIRTCTYPILIEEEFSCPADFPVEYRLSEFEALCSEDPLPEGSIPPPPPPPPVDEEPEPRPFRQCADEQIVRAADIERMNDEGCTHVGNLVIVGTDLVTLDGIDLLRIEGLVIEDNPLLRDVSALLEVPNDGVALIQNNPLLPGCLADALGERAQESMISGNCRTPECDQVCE